MDYVDSFLNGARMAEKVSYVTGCSSIVRNIYRNVSDATVYIASPYNIWYEKIFKTTETISRPISQIFGNCSLTVYSLSNQTYTFMNSFPDSTNFLMAFV